MITHSILIYLRFERQLVCASGMSKATLENAKQIGSSERRTLHAVDEPMPPSMTPAKTLRLILKECTIGCLLAYEAIARCLVCVNGVTEATVINAEQNASTERRTHKDASKM